jgi:hypothetical protein
MLVTVLLSALLGGIAGALGVLLAKLFTRGSGAARAKQISRVVYAITVGVGLSLGPVFARSLLGDTVAVALGVKSRSEVVLTSAMRAFMEDPRLKAQLEGKDAAFAQAHAASLTARGITLLPAGELERWAFLRLRLAEVSPAYCAAAWRGGLTPRDLYRALDALTEEEQQRWGELVTRGGQLALDTPPAETAHGRTLQRGIATIAATLPPDERADFDRDVGLADPGAERACQLVQLVFRGAATLPAQERDAFLRALAANAR